MELFITYTDLTKKMKPARLAELVEGDTSLYDEACASAQAEVEAFLCEQFDTAADFSKEGIHRAKFLVDVCANLAIGELLGRCTPKLVPEMWLDKVEFCRSQLRMMKKGELTPPGLTPRRTGTAQDPIGHTLVGSWEPLF